MSDECQHETICSDCGAMTTGYAALTARAEAAEQQAARLRAAALRLKRRWDRLTDCVNEFEPDDMGACGETRDMVDSAIGGVIEALAASQPAPADEAQP